MSTARLKSVSLPSGAVVTLRPLRVEEISLVASMGSNTSKRANTERFDSLVRVLQNCTVSVEDNGPFAAFTWAKTNDGDQFAGIFALRALSFGNTMPMVKPCEACGEKFDATPSFLPTDEGGDLRVFPMPAEARAALGDSCLLPPFTLPSGAVIVCRVMAGAARKEALKIAEGFKDDPLMGGLRGRIVSMTTADGAEVSPNDLTRAVRNLDAADIGPFQDYVTEMDGGVDDDMPLECTHCGHVNEEPTGPFYMRADFWGIPQSRRRAR